MAVPQRTLTETEYLERERTGPVRHEFYQGQIYAMAGSSEAHNTLTVLLVATLVPQVRGRGCRVHASDLRVRVSPTGLYTYPDVLVVCGERRFLDERSDTLLNPTVIFEVLSPSTETYDWSTKFAHYQTLPSLQEYILVAQERVQVEQYVRQGESDTWVLRVHRRQSDSLVLPSIGCAIPLAAIYEPLDLPEGLPPLENGSGSEAG